MDKAKEIEFVFHLMCEQLSISAPQIEPIFIALKDGKDSNLLETLNPQEISSLIKAFTLYHLLLNVIDERYRLSKAEKNKIQDTITELRAQKYDDADIAKVLRKIRFYPVFTAHPTESLRRTFLESYHEMCDDLDLWFKFGKVSAKEHLKYRLNLLWNSHIVRSEKIEVLFELDNLLYFMESSILQSGANTLKEVCDSLATLGDKESLKKSPIRLGSWIGGDRDGNPYVTNAVMLEVMKKQHETIICEYLKRIDKLIRELSIAQDCIAPTQELLDSIESEHLDSTAKKLFLQEPFRAKLACMRQKLKNRLLMLNLPQSALSENRPYMYANSKEFIADITMMIDSLDFRSSVYLRELRDLATLAGFHLM